MYRKAVGRLIQDVFRSASTSTVVILLLGSCLSQIPQPKDGFSLNFGPKGGADHLMIMVKDLRSTTEKFRSLGFNINPWGQFAEGGLENAVMYFGNETFLEFLGVYDKEKAAGTAAAKFLEKHEGSNGFAVEVASAAMTAQALKDHGIEVVPPEPFPPVKAGNSISVNWFWKSVEFRNNAPPGTPFLIEYNRPLFEKFETPDKARAKITHANTALAVTSVWIAVSDLEAARKSYAAVGLAGGETFHFPELSATGYKVRSGKASILLLNAKDGPVHRFATDRGDGIMGVTIRVAKMAEFRKRLPVDWSNRFKNYDRNKLIIPGDLTNGLWIEVTE
jgi:catechol 2,3-dioxygenase-like lactoylglutathione lyase family enzyme